MSKLGNLRTAIRLAEQLLAHEGAVIRVADLDGFPSSKRGWEAMNTVWNAESGRTRNKGRENLRRVTARLERVGAIRREGPEHARVVRIVDRPLLERWLVAARQEQARITP